MNRQFRLFGIAQNVFQYHLQVSFYQKSSVLCARRPRTDAANPGLDERLKLYEEDPEFVKSVEGEDDLDDVEADFMEVDDAYDEHKKEIRKQKDYVAKKIIVQKFFKLPKQPNMLTWNEKQQIKFLYNKDPDEWNVEKLSESFPATKEVIKKVLKAKWQPENMEKMKKKDEKVHENWKLLKEGKLEAAPSFIKHLKKFTERREEMLSSEKDDWIGYLEEGKKEEPVWNNGQMRSIIDHYEKSILDLKKQYEANTNPVKEIESGAGDMKSTESGIQDPETTVKERIHLDLMLQPSKDRDEFNLGNSDIGMGNQVTLKELQKSIRKRADDGKKISVLDQLILDDKLRTESSKESNLKMNYEEKSNSESKENRFNYDLHGSGKLNQSKRQINLKENNPQNMFVDNMTSESHKINKRTASVEEGKSRRKVINAKLEQLAGYNIEENEIESDISHSKVENSSKEEVKVDEVIKYEYEYNDERDREYFEKEEKSIENTFFWGTEKPTDVQNTMDNYDKHVEKRISKPVTEVSYVYDYPDRITIPKSKRGSGLTFKVEDCFYDDDGEFLYRVPGMKE